MMMKIPRRLLLDIETQRDFFCPGGSCYTRQASLASENISRLFDWARREGVPVISTLLRVRPAERGPLCCSPHCVEGTEGERKLDRALLASRTDLGLRNITDLPADLLERYQQVIFEKRDTDIFKHLRIERLISRLAEAAFILLGAGVADGIVQAAIGLRSRGYGVILVSDAVLDFGDARSDMAYLRMEAKGVIFAPTARIISPPTGRADLPPMRVTRGRNRRVARAMNAAQGR